MSVIILPKSVPCDLKECGKNVKRVYTLIAEKDRHLHFCSAECGRMYVIHRFRFRYRKRRELRLADEAERRQSC